MQRVFKTDAGGDGTETINTPNDVGLTPTHILLYAGWTEDTFQMVSSSINYVSDKRGLHPVMLAHVIIVSNPVPCIISMPPHTFLLYAGWTDRLLKVSSNVSLYCIIIARRRLDFISLVQLYHSSYTTRKTITIVTFLSKRKIFSFVLNKMDYHEGLDQFKTAYKGT